MHLCKKDIVEIRKSSPVLLPEPYLFKLEEKVLQFGTGVLLRGLVDYIIDKANKKNQFNGRVVVVKSTEEGTTDNFKMQNCLYTVVERGIEKGRIINEHHCVASISRVLSAKSDWRTILQSVAENPSLQIVVSNTTELGLVFYPEDIFLNPPTSFPAKLLAVLHHRFIAFNGDVEKGLIIIPTELIPDNGKVLLAIILQLASHNNLSATFTEWVKNANYFCSSLVDRIVPGKPQEVTKQKIESDLGYRDDLLIIAEPYHLWAIETNNETVKAKLSFAVNNNNVIIAADINKYRELKLRLLNGTHTFCCGLAYLAGFNTVKQAMENEIFYAYISNLMKEEIIPIIINESISIQEAEAFARDVIDRFSNDFIEHKWLNICLQYSTKMTTRNLPILIKYLDNYKLIPQRVALGMAAHILFLKSHKNETGLFFGTKNGINYPISDLNAETYYNAWKLKEVNLVVEYLWANSELHQQINAEKFKLEIIKWLQLLLANPVLKIISLTTNTVSKNEI